MQRAALLAVAVAVVQGARAAEVDLPVDVELVLAVDVSRSIDAEERLLQRQGYVAALRHPEVMAAIRSGEFGRISVIYIEWAGPGEHRIVMPWRLIEDSRSAEAAADWLDRPTVEHLRGTSISSALLFSFAAFDSNGFDGTRQVIDISGDGPNNSGPSVVGVRDQIVAQGIVINGLPVILNPGGRGGMPAPALKRYFEECVIGGAGAFIVPIEAREQFPNAIKRKLIMEISSMEPRPDIAGTIRRAAASICDVHEKRQRRKWRVPPIINDHPYDGPSLAEGGAPSTDG